MSLVERLKQHPFLLDVGVAAITVFMTTWVLAGFELLHFGAAENVVRLVVYPERPGFWETYQTLIAGICTATGGAFVIVAAHVNNRANERQINYNEKRKIRSIEMSAKFQAQRIQFDADLVSSNIKGLIEYVSSELKMGNILKFNSTNMADIPPESISPLMNPDIITIITPKQISAVMLAEKSVQHFHYFMGGFNYYYTLERIKENDPVSYLKHAHDEAISLSRCLDFFLDDFQDSALITKELGRLSDDLIEYLDSQKSKTHQKS